MVLSDHLHEALQDLDAALKSQPRLFLGRHAKATTTNILALAAAAAAGGGGKPSLSSVKTDSSALLHWKKVKQGSQEQDREADRKVLRPTLSKVSITSLEFSEALPFAAFASLLVEAVARLDLVIEEVEELGRVANFREFNEGDEAVCSKPETGNPTAAAAVGNHLPHHASDC